MDRPADSGQRSLNELIRALRAERVDVGTAETIDAARLLKQLALDNSDLERPEQLEAMLRAVLCKSKSDQEKFARAFEQWVAGWPRKRDGAQRPPSGLQEKGKRGEDEESGGRSRIALGAVAAIAALAIAVAGGIWNTRQPGRPTPVNPSPLPTPQPTPAPTPPIPGPRERNPDEIAIYGYFPSVYYSDQLMERWLWLLLGTPFLFLLMFDMRPRILTGGRAKNAAETLPLSGWSDALRAQRLVLPLLSETGGRLSRHVRGPASEIRRLSRRPQLDLARTLEATTLNLGVPTARYRDTKLMPSYLILVEADSDQELPVYWSQRLESEALDLDIRRLVKRDGTIRVVPRGAPPKHEGIALSALPSPPYGQRLIVVSDGTWMVDQDGNRTPESLAARFSRWPHRVFFTTREPVRWGALESSIQRADRADRIDDLGFLLLPIDENALDGWSQFLVSGKLPPIELESPQRYPRIIHDTSEDALLSESPPAELSQLIVQLKLYLGPNAFFWLCCCAVPPLIKHELVLHLGESFMRQSGAGDRDLGYYLARNYRLLERLPWIRREHMPSWLRVTLLASVSSSIREEVRSAVDAKLTRLAPADTRPAEVAISTGGAAVDQTPDASGDTLFLGFMSGMSPQALALRVPEQWHEWIRALEPGRPPRRVDAIRRLRALWDRLRFHEGLVYRGPRRWASIAGTAWLVAAAIALAAVVRTPAADFPPNARSILFEDTARRVDLQHDGTVWDAQFSHDGSRVVTASSDNTAGVWDARTGRPITEPLQHRGVVWDAQFSPDGSRVVTASSDNTARVWDARIGLLITEPLQHDGAVSDAHFSADGSRVVTASADHTARVWDATTGLPIAEPLQHNETVLHAHFSPDGSRVVTASRDNTARIWDAAPGLNIASPLQHEDGLHTAQFSPDGSRIVTASNDNTARVWEAVTGLPVTEPLQHDGGVITAQFSPDGSRIVTGCIDGTARVWDAVTARPIMEPLQHGDFVNNAQFSPDGSRIVTGSGDGTVRVWDAMTGQPITEPLQHTGGVNSTQFSPDGELIVTATSDDTVRVVDAVTGVPVPIIEPLQHGDFVNDAQFSPDGSRIVTASDDNTARVWDAVTGQPITKPLQHYREVYTARFSPGGSRIVTGSGDGTARVWDAVTGLPITEPLQHDAYVNNAQFSPDGSRIVTGSGDGTARVWDADTGVLTGVPVQVRGQVTDVQFAPDARRIVVATMTTGENTSQSGSTGTITATDTANYPRLWEPNAAYVVKIPPHPFPETTQSWLSLKTTRLSALGWWWGVIAFVPLTAGWLASSISTARQRSDMAKYRSEQTTRA